MRNTIANKTFIIFLITAVTAILLFGLFKPEEISSRYDKERFWAEKTHCPPIYNIVFTGDSRIYRAISPAEVQKSFASPIHVLNFGYSSAGLNTILLHKAVSKLATDTSPKILVLGITANALSQTAEVKANTHLLQEYNRSAYDIYDRIYTNKYLSFFEPTTLSSLLKRVSGNKNGYYEKFEKNGWVASHKVPSDSNEAYNTYKKRFSNNRLDQSVIDSLLLYTKSLYKQGIQVYAFRPPTTRALKNLEDSLMHFDEEKFKADFVKAGGAWISIPDSMYFYAYDGSHLDKTSAIKLSHYIGQELKQLNALYHR